MAQLRDAQTSELIAEGTPEEIAFAAEAFAAGEVLFDDVGAVNKDGTSIFNPAAVRQHHADELAGLETALAAQPGDGDTATKRGLRDAIKNRRARRDAGQALTEPAREAARVARERSRKRANR